MNDIPASGTFDSATLTVANARQAFTDLLDNVRRLPGVKAGEDLTISSGVLTPTGQAGLIVADTEAAAAADDLDRVSTTNMPDGSFLWIFPASAARVITIKHDNGGTGRFELKRDLDFVMDGLHKGILVRLNGNTWWEVLRTVDDRLDMGGTSFTGFIEDVSGNEIEVWFQGSKIGNFNGTTGTYTAGS